MTPCPKPAKRPPKERKPLRRTRMRKKPPKRLSRAGSDPAYLAWVRRQPCIIGCASTLIHAHHAIHRSQGGKDDSAVPLCLHHHASWHQATGVFQGLSKFERFAWTTRAIAETRAAWAKRGRDGT